VIERLGYPTYFLVILGVWKLLGAVALVIPRFPRLKEWAYAGVVFNLTGALISHVVSGDIEPGPMAYLVTMIGATAASWFLRPPSRRNFQVSFGCSVMMCRCAKFQLCSGKAIRRLPNWHKVYR
jgi:hypothetical protein